MTRVKNKYKLPKKRNERAFGGEKCELCCQRSMFLTVEKICRCVMKETDFITRTMFLDGVEKEVKIINPSEKKTLKLYYRSLVSRRRQDKRKKATITSTKTQQAKKESYAQKRKAFYESDEWRRLRYVTLVRYGRKCMLCFATDKEIHCDHIKPLSLHWELRLDPDNIQVLCKDCNFGKSNISQEDFRPKP